MEKNTLRKVYKEKREKLDSIHKKRMDSEIENKFLNTNIYKNSKVVFIYVGMENEINTKNIIEKVLKDNKEVIVPKVEIKNKIMKAIKINSIDELKPCGYYGILEPLDFSKEIDINKVDLVIVPGLAFDKYGGRLGYGGGYYDKFLQKINYIYKLALAYDFQIIDFVPMEKHDIKVDLLITNKEIINTIK